MFQKFIPERLALCIEPQVSFSNFFPHILSYLKIGSYTSVAIRYIGQPLDNILALCHTNNWYTRNLPYPPLEIPIVRRDKINPMLLHAIDNAVIGISSLVIALETLPALVTGNAQGNAVFGTEFFQLGHDARGDDGCGFGVEQVHKGFVQLELGVDGVREKVGVYEDGVGRAEGGVGLEEEGGGDLWAER